MILAPVVFFVYNRPWHTKQTSDSLSRNKLASQTDLFIFSDGPRNSDAVKEVETVREQIRNISGFKDIKITERKENLGLANSIISGVTDVINRYGRIIVIEDDMVFKTDFLRFMNEALEFYESEKKVFSVTGYNYPEELMDIPESYNHDIYFYPRCSSWGWGTWKDRWAKADWEFKDADEFLKNKKLRKKYAETGEDKADMMLAHIEGKIDSWATRWEYAHFVNNAYSVYPVKSFLNNIGFDGTGINCGFDKKYHYQDGLKESEYNIRFLSKIELDKNISREFGKIFKKDRFATIKTIIKKIIFYDRWRKRA